MKLLKSNKWQLGGAIASALLLCLILFQVFVIAPVARQAARVGTYTGLRENQSALKRNPNDPSALRGMADESTSNKDFSQAVKYLKQAVKVEPENTNNKYLLGIALSRAGQRDEARRTFEELASTDNPEKEYAQRIVEKLKRNPNWGLYRPKVASTR